MFAINRAGAPVPNRKGVVVVRVLALEWSTVALIILGVSASIGCYRFYYLPCDYSFGYPFGRDFINFWAGGRLAMEGKTPLLVDPEGYNGWLSQWIGTSYGDFVFSYPPSLVPFLLPFGALPYGYAMGLWTCANFAAATAAAASCMTKEHRLVAVLLVALSPAMAINGFQGILSGLTAALFLLALAHMDERPWLAGLCLGLLSIKPHLGLVLGLIVLIERRYTVIAATALTIAAMVALSLAVVDASVWIGYFTTMVREQRGYLETMAGGFRHFLITPYAMLKLLGVNPGVAMTMHVAVAISSISVAIIAWKRIGDRILAGVIVALASVLATPYANLYDLPLVALPLAISVARYGVEGVANRAALVVLWLLPALGLTIAIGVAPIVPAILVIVGGIVSYGIVQRHREQQTIPAKI